MLALVLALVLVLAWAGSLLWAATAGWGAVHKIAAEPTSSNRPAAGSGLNYLMVGSDSRAGLTRAQRAHLGTGFAEGQRTDSILLIHLPASGDPTMLSIPRDSYVPIPGHNHNKINASYSIGGAPLLIETVEQVTGLRINGFIEIGFGGFANVVDSVGGVRMCLKAPMKDAKAHINLPRGCQVLDGKNALGFVRARYSDPLGDLGRVKRQRQFLSALLSTAATPANLLLPWRLHDLGVAAGASLSVDQNDSMLEVAKVMLALRSIAQGHGQSVTIPISNPNLQTPAGDAVKWDTPKARALFAALRHDTPLTVKPS